LLHCLLAHDIRPRLLASGHCVRTAYILACTYRMYVCVVFTYIDFIYFLSNTTSYLASYLVLLISSCAVGTSIYN
jgi:hypothetical protein